MKPTRLQLAEHVTTTHHHTPELGIAIEDVCKPSYWANVARQMRPGDKIELLSPMGDWWALLIVRNVGKVEAAVSVLFHKVLDSAPAITAPESPYEVRYRGPTVRFSVLRKDNQSVVKEHFQTKEEAEMWVKNHEKAMAA